ncbi:archaellin/type IV pilin N-terminal domain-containing protein [Caldivirga sp. MU80]|uniref:archaellin/type IV pilin N-terminal domain-containing protein n=1 Tax=Caldivirga sp. MU80 TaxID=1650354 RepID=UPI000B022DDA|nr:archaellin/type IV pilin N-terminal domain-containing protein [Caldivirga sp. MU80]
MVSRNRNAKRGIEPIVAAILLIVITVVAAVLLYMWFSGYLTATTGRVSSMSSPEEFQVVAVSLSATNGLNAYIQNTGSTTITITDVYILNSTTVCNVTIPETMIPPGQTAPITSSVSNINELTPSGPISCVIVPGTSYLVKFVTAEGTQYAVSVVASS